MALVVQPYNFDVGGFGKSHPLPFSDIDPGQTVATRRKPMGMMEPGNINIKDRPSVWNPKDGGYSSVYSMSFEDEKGRHVLVPLVNDQGGIDEPDKAVERYQKTGRHLGVFSPAAGDEPSAFADAYANDLHLQQEKMFTDARAAAAVAAFATPGGK